MAIEGPLRELGIHDVFQLLDLIRVELERAAKRLERLLVAFVVEQRAPQQQQGRQVVRVLLEHLGEAHHGRPRAPAAAQQVRQRQLPR